MSTEPETIPAPTLANQVNLAQIPTQQDKDELVAVTTGMPPLARPPPSDIGSLSSSNPTGRIPRTSAAGALLTGAVESNKIYVGGLPVNATIEDLQDCFGQMGECTCILKSGFGFVVSFCSILLYPRAVYSPTPLAARPHRRCASSLARLRKLCAFLLG